MEVLEKLIITPKWSEIRKLFKENTNGSSKYQENFEVGGDLDTLTEEFIFLLGRITEEIGYNCTIEGVKLDLWKERIWTIIEKAGLLPPIAWRDDKEEDEEDEEYEYEYFDEDKFHDEVLSKVINNEEE